MNKTVANKPFWQTKSLAQLSTAEWESLCDGCGKCCLHKLLEERDDMPADAPMALGEDLHFTHVACQLLDREHGGCSNYAQRHRYVPGCVQLSADNLDDIHYLPASCAYRRLYEGRDLPAWHPLRHNGSRAAMEQAGMAVTCHPTYSDAEREPTSDDIVRWPLVD